MDHRKQTVQPRAQAQRAGFKYLLVQVTLLPLVVSHNTEELDVLAQEAGGNQAMDSKLQPFFKCKGHPLGE